VNRKHLNGSKRYEISPGAVAMIFTTKDYEDAKAKLDKYARSSYLSDNVRIALKEFSDVIYANMSMMIDLLNDEYRKDPLILLKCKENNSPYFETCCEAAPFPRKKNVPSGSLLR
jgi:hypothetical protein